MNLTVSRRSKARVPDRNESLWSLWLASIPDAVNGIQEDNNEH